MSLRILPRAKRDIDAITQYIADRNRSAAQTFLGRLDKTFEVLTRFPDGGTTVPTRNPKLVGLQRIPVWQSKTYVVYYVFRSRVEIVRVMHSARDRDALLEDEP